MGNKGFVKTFIGVCSGTEIFPELAEFPLLKAIGHLILLALVCAAANIATRYHPFNVEFEKACVALQNKFGGLRYTSKGVVPEKEPDKPATLAFDDFRVDYFPNQKDLNHFKPDDDCDGGFVWTPRSIIYWRLIANEPTPLLPLLVPTTLKGDSLTDQTTFFWDSLRNSPNDSSLKHFAKLYQVPKSQPITNDSSYFRDFRSNIFAGVPLKLPILYILLLGAEILINALLISPLYILVFTLFSSTLGKSEMLGMKFSQLFVVGLYTGMPGTVIATLYTLLELPYLDYQSVFLMAYVIYSFPVFSRLRMERLKTKNS